MSIDVIVIGGGFAGITAARELNHLGKKVLVLEARDRLGGRTYTTEFEGYQVELGGTYVHSTQPFIWTEIQRYGLHAYGDPAEDNKVIYYDGKQSTHLDGDSWLQQMTPVFEQYFEPSHDVWPYPYDAKSNWELLASLDNKTALDRLNELDLTIMQKTTLTAFIEVCSHNAIENCSYVEMMRWFALSGHNLTVLLESIGTYKLREGTSSLINAIANDANADIQLSTKVSEVKIIDNCVQVISGNGEIFEAKDVLVTVPMNVVNEIDFNPPLSQARTIAASTKHVGEGFKAILVAKGNLGAIWCCSAHADCPLMSVSNYHIDDDKTLLIAYGYSESPVDLADEKQMQKWMRNYLPDVEILKSTGHSWSDDPLSQGTWCTYRPGQMTQYFEDLQIDQEHIFFAGADIGNGWRGFIDGAISSGINSARRIAGR